MEDYDYDTVTTISTLGHLGTNKIPELAINWSYDNFLIMATGGDKNLEFKIGMKKKSIKKDINIKLPSAFNRKMAVIKK